MRIKISYDSETKKLIPPSDYASLLAYAQKAFPTLPQKFEFYYQDNEGDIISIGNNDEWLFEMTSLEEQKIQ